jgi:hypothetical protein
MMGRTHFPEQEYAALFEIFHSPEILPADPRCLSSLNAGGARFIGNTRLFPPPSKKCGGLLTLNIN